MMRHNRYDVVFMDCQMPEMDGLEATRAIRDYEIDVATGSVDPPPKSAFASARLKKGRIPIVAVTANAMIGDRQRCLDAGMDAYLAKPIHPELLMENIVRFLCGKKPDCASGCPNPCAAAEDHLMSEEALAPLRKTLL